MDRARLEDQTDGTDGIDTAVQPKSCRDVSRNSCNQTVETFEGLGRRKVKHK